MDCSCCQNPHKRAQAPASTSDDRCQAIPHRSEAFHSANKVVIELDCAKKLAPEQSRGARQVPRWKLPLAGPETGDRSYPPAVEPRAIHPTPLKSQEYGYIEI